MRLLRSIRWGLIALGILVGLSLCYYWFVLDWQGRPFCHKQIMMSLLTWIDDHKTNAFPNVRGMSRDSLAAITEEMNGTAWAVNYKYIPGLHKDDPGDLVLMYVARPTRWNWHGSPPTIFRHKAWILVPVEFEPRSHAGTELGELSERVPAKEFRQRLRNTLDFIRTNERPNWEAVLAEHTKLLGSLEREKQ